MAGRQRIVAWMFVAAGLLSSPSVAVGQLELAVMQGVVTDEEGKPLEGAVLTLKDLDRGRAIVIKSDKSGRFYRRGLQAVDYEFTVEKEGYQPLNDKVRLTAGTDRRFDFKLVRAAPVGAEELLKGIEAFNRRDYQAAVGLFEEAAKKAPDLLEVHVNLALAYFRLGRTEDAAAELQKAAQIAPDDPRVSFQLGGVYVEMNDLDKASAALEKGLAARSDLSDPIVFEATVTLGAVYFAKGKNPEAAAQFQKALAANPNAATPKLGLAKVYFSQGDVEKALATFEQVLAAAPPGSPEAVEAESFITELKKVKGDGEAA